MESTNEDQHTTAFTIKVMAFILFVVFAFMFIIL